jgi:hypothetical protein
MHRRSDGVRANQNPDYARLRQGRAFASAPSAPTLFAAQSRARRGHDAMRELTTHFGHHPSIGPPSAQPSKNHRPRRRKAGEKHSPCPTIGARRERRQHRASHRFILLGTHRPTRPLSFAAQRKHVSCGRDARPCAATDCRPSSAFTGSRTGRPPLILAQSRPPFRTLSLARAAHSHPPSARTVTAFLMDFRDQHRGICRYSLWQPVAPVLSTHADGQWQRLRCRFGNGPNAGWTPSARQMARCRSFRRPKRTETDLSAIPAKCRARGF